MIPDVIHKPPLYPLDLTYIRLVVQDIFIGNEMIPDVINKPPLYPLDLTYRLVVGDMR